MALQLRNYWYVWQRSWTFTLSLWGLLSRRISFGLWFRSIRDEVVEARPQASDAAYDAVIYHPLTFPDSIRVLILEPGRQSDPLKASLEERRLHDATTIYEALSYCWGVFSLASGNRIEMQGSAVRISDNLDEALRSLRSEKDQRVLWVDFVCINQTDIQERVCQVNMMGDIYREAAKVVVWLGMPTPASQLGIEILSFLAGNEELTKGGPWERNSPDNVIAALNDIVERPYFQRIWVVQEGALARITDVHVGHLRLSWSQGNTTFRFLSRIKFAQISPAWEYSGLSGVDLQPLIDTLTVSRLALARARGVVVKPSIIDVLHDMRRRMSTDPRDMIFALLGLGLETYGVMASYEISREETYLRLFERFNQAAQQEMREFDVRSVSTVILDSSLLL